MEESKKVIQEDEIDLLELAKVLWSKRRFIIKVTAIFAAFGLLIAFTSKVEYEASCKLMPESQEQILFISLLSLIYRSSNMETKYILTGYIEQLLSLAEYDKLEDGSFVGRIPKCKGVISFDSSLIKCEAELRSTLEDWILLGLKLGHSLPVVGRIDLNKKPSHASLEAM